MTPSSEEQRTKDLLKEAMLELLEERKDLFYDLFADVIEDTFLAPAIQEGGQSEKISNDDIIHLLAGDS